MTLLMAVFVLGALAGAGLMVLWFMLLFARMMDHIDDDL